MEESKQKIPVLLFNKFQGYKQGVLFDKDKKNQNLFGNLNQTVKQKHKHYVIGTINKKTGKIKWEEVNLMSVQNKIDDDKKQYTTIQDWSKQHKLRMVGTFGTSKSKRKLNQMMSNVIS